VILLFYELDVGKLYAFRCDRELCGWLAILKGHLAAAAAAARLSNAKSVIQFLLRLSFAQ